jgi:DNA polymerase-3 subunit gamma/tau
VEGALSNLALYRKYRSAGFDEVVGQQHVVKTLTNAIKNGKHSHAYLLTGPRGVGKTTIARIIAKDVNGLKKVDVISEYLDIIEIDGASNRGIDEIRSLREKVQVAPAKLQYKIYIIDEVHMLTKEAFNALLKTLEEPPPHVIFIFATTDVHKLPDTIISRTQRFDFRPIAKDEMVKHLRFIADQENILITDEALALIAQLSKGGFRDAISLLDQVSVSDGEIGVETISDFTGIQDSSVIENILVLLKDKKTKEVILAIQDLINSGVDVGLFLQQMLEYVQLELVDSAKFSHDFLIELAENLHWAQSNMRHSSSPELVLQIGLLRSSRAPRPQQHEATQPAPEQKHEKVIEAQKVESPGEPQPKSEQKGSKSNEDLLIKSLSVIKHYNNSLFAVLKGAEVKVDNDEVNIACRFSFHKDRILEQRNSSLIEKAFSKVYGKSMHIVVKVDNSNKPKEVNPEEELVSSAAAIFGAEVTDV